VLSYKKSIPHGVRYSEIVFKRFEDLEYQPEERALEALIKQHTVSELLVRISFFKGPSTVTVFLTNLQFHQIYNGTISTVLSKELDCIGDSMTTL
jgi:hypothetical protein